MRHLLRFCLTLVGIGAISSLVLSIWVPLPHASRIVYGSLLVLFLPGYVWSFVFWKPSKITILERLVLAIPLSGGQVALGIYLFHQLGGSFSLLVSLSVVGLWISSGLLILFFSRFPSQGKNPLRHHQK